MQMSMGHLAGGLDIPPVSPAKGPVADVASEGQISAIISERASFSTLKHWQVGVILDGRALPSFLLSPDVLYASPDGGPHSTLVVEGETAKQPDPKHA
jgi:hypothetical protein